MAKYKKKTVKNKFYKGTQEVIVPQTMTNADVGASALSGAAAGAAMGSVAGPWGTIVGGVAGGAVGAYKGVIDKDKSIIANKNAKNLNQQAFKDANTAEDNKLQNYQFKKGTRDIDGDFDNSKVIEIEGKKFPEIHTDKNYKIKTLGIKPHTEGGTKTIATEGDIVFDTQDNKKDYKKVISDISLYKLKGDKNAFKRLEKRRKEMPADDGSNKAPDGNQSLDPYTQNTGTDMFGDPIIDKGNNYDQLGYSKDKINPLNGTGTLDIPNGGNSSLSFDKPSANEKKNIPNIGRYANIAYNAIQAFNTPKEPYNLKYRMDKYKYTDVSDPLRNAAIQNRSTQLSNAGKAGTSIGQQLSYGQQAQNQYVDQLGKINANETDRKQNVQNANVDLSNQENQVNYSRAITSNDIQNQRLVKQQAFGATAVNEFANINEANNNANTLSKNQKEINSVSAKRDEQYLNLFSEKNFKITPELKAEYVKSGSTKPIATWAAEDYKVFAKGTSGINTKKTSTYSYKTKNK